MIFNYKLDINLYFLKYNNTLKKECIYLRKIIDSELNLLHDGFLSSKNKELSSNLNKFIEILRIREDGIFEYIKRVELINDKYKINLFNNPVLQEYDKYSIDICSEDVFQNNYSILSDDDKKIYDHFIHRVKKDESYLIARLIDIRNIIKNIHNNKIIKFCSLI